MYAGLQHSLLLFFLLLATEFVRRVVNLLMTGDPIGWYFLLIPLMSAIVWPFIDLLLGHLRRRVRVE